MSNAARGAPTLGSVPPGSRAGASAPWCHGPDRCQGKPIIGSAFQGHRNDELPAREFDEDSEAPLPARPDIHIPPLGQMDTRDIPAFWWGATASADAARWRVTARAVSKKFKP